MLSKTFSSIAKSQRANSTIAKIIANGAASTFGQSVSSGEGQSTSDVPSYLQSNRQFSTPSFDVNSSQLLGGTSAFSQAIGAKRQFTTSTTDSESEAVPEKSVEDIVLDAFIDVKKKSEPAMAPYLEQFADIIKDGKTKEEVAILSAGVFNQAGFENGAKFKSQLMYTAFQADAVSALMKDSSVSNEDFPYKAADAYMEVINKTDPELSPFIERFKQIRNVSEESQSKGEYEKLFSDVIETGGDVSKRFWDVVDDAESLAFNLATRDSHLSQNKSSSQGLPKTHAEKVGDSVFNAFLNVAKQKDPQLEPYIDQVQKIEQGDDEVQKADEYSKLWEQAGQEGGKTIQAKLAVALSKAQDLSDRSQFSTEAELFESELGKMGPMSNPESIASNEILSSVSLGDIRNIMDAREQIATKPVDSQYRQLAENIAQKRIRSENGGSSYLLNSDLEELYDTPMRKGASYDGILTAVAPVVDTVEQVSRKLGILSNFYPSSVGEDLSTEGKGVSEKEMILSVCEKLEADKNPTTRKIKEALPELSGDLAEKLREEVLAEGEQDNPDKKKKQHEKIATAIDTVRTINEEAANIDELEKFYSGMAAVVQKGKSSAAQTMFDDSEEIPFSELPRVNERIEQISSAPYIKKPSSESKKGIQAFADKFLSQRYSEMVETKDIPLDKDYWDTIKAMDLMSEEYQYRSIVPDNLRQAQDGKEMPKALEDITKQQQDKDKQNQR